MTDSVTVKRPHSSVKHTCLMSGGIFLVALVVRVAFYLLRDRMAIDSYHYIAAAKFLADANWDWALLHAEKAFHYPPLLISAMALLSKLGMSVKSAGILICLVSGALAPVGVYLAAVQLFRARLYALFAAALIAFHPYCVELSTSVLRDAPYHCFVAFALAAGIRGAVSGWLLPWVWFGLVTGMAALFRREAPELLIIFLVWTAVSFIRDSSGFKAKMYNAAVRIFVVFSGFALLTFPLWFIVYRQCPDAWLLYQPFFNILRM